MVEQNEVSIKNQTLWVVRFFTCLYTHSFPSLVLYNNTKEFRERERGGAYDVTVAVAVKEAEQVERVGHYPFKEKQKQK